MSDADREVPSREDFQRWVEEYLYYEGKGISDYYANMGSYLHDQLVRWRHGRIIRGLQTEWCPWCGKRHDPDEACEFREAHEKMKRAGEALLAADPPERGDSPFRPDLPDDFVPIGLVEGPDMKEGATMGEPRAAVQRMVRHQGVDAAGVEIVEINAQVWFQPGTLEGSLQDQMSAVEKALQRWADDAAAPRVPDHLVFAWPLGETGDGPVDMDLQVERARELVAENKAVHPSVVSHLLALIDDQDEELRVRRRTGEEVAELTKFISERYAGEAAGRRSLVVAREKIMELEDRVAELQGDYDGDV